jgi:hypothetical protein
MGSIFMSAEKNGDEGMRTLPERANDNNLMQTQNTARRSDARHQE